MHDGKAVPSAILMADAFGRPTTDGIDDVGRAFNGTETVPQAVAERVDDASIWHPWLKPFVQCRTGGVGIPSDSECFVLMTQKTNGSYLCPSGGDRAQARQSN